MIIGPGITITGGIYVDSNVPATPPPSSDFGGSGSFNVTASNQTYQIPVNSAFTYGTGDFTVEWFSYQTGFSGVQGIWRNSTGDATNSIGFWTITQPSGRLTITLGNGVSSNTILSNAVIPLHSWKHYAFVRNGTLFKLYVDGVGQTQTITSSINIPAQVGIMQIGNAGGNYSGLITNFRIVKGTAVYLNDFTPPTSPLTAISGTSLLLSFASAALLTKDDSPNNFTITNTGPTTYSVASPSVTEGIVSSGLALSLDAGNVVSYPGSGTVWTDSTGGKVFRLYNGGRVSAVQTDPPTYNSASGGYIQFDNSKRQWANCTTSLADLNSYSVEGWWNIDAGNLTTSVFNLLADKINSRYNYGLGMGQVTSNKFSLHHLKAGAVPKVDSTNNANTYFNTGWMHICGTFNNTTSKMNLYINGALAATEVTISSGGTPLSGGAGIHMATRNDTSNDTQYNFLNGSIAVARIYNTALTASQVTQNYNAQRARFGLSDIVTSGLQFNLATAPSTGSTWTDSSGNGRNATLLGSPSYVSNNGGGIRLNNPDNSGTDYISVPYNIASNTVTVEVVASFNPTSFWGAIWSNEIFNTIGGYLAYMDSSTNLYYGIPDNETLATITASNAIRHWIFVINGTQSSVFLNGSQVGITDTASNQTLFATNDFYFGARHNNDGIGFGGDTLNNSDSALYPVFYQMRVYNKALSGAEITQNYNAVKGTYGI
jgi:hypothetical protein